MELGLGAAGRTCGCGDPPAAAVLGGWPRTQDWDRTQEDCGQRRTVTSATVHPTQLLVFDGSNLNYDSSACSELVLRRVLAGLVINNRRSIERGSFHDTRQHNTTPHHQPVTADSLGQLIDCLPDRRGQTERTAWRDVLSTGVAPFPPQSAQHSTAHGSCFHTRARTRTRVFGRSGQNPTAHGPSILLHSNRSQRFASRV